MQRRDQHASSLTNPLPRGPRERPAAGRVRVLRAAGDDPPVVRVLVVSPPAPLWGAELYLLDTVQPLRDRGVELTLASPADSPLAEVWAERGWPLHPVPMRLHGGLRRNDGSDRRPGPGALLTDVSHLTASAMRLARVAKCYDMVHSYALRSHIEVVAAARLARRPVALDLVNIVRPGMGRYLLRAAARGATLTVANSAATASVVGNGPAVRVIHPGIDLARFRPGPTDAQLRSQLSAAPAEPLVAIIGRLDEEKGVHVLVDAMTRLRGASARAHLVVVGQQGTGPGEYAERLRAEAREALGERVRFVGRRSDVPDILRNVDVLVNASFAEPFGLSVLEAQACGTVVVGTAAGGIPEFVEDGVTGFLVPPFDAVSLAAVLTRVIEDEATTSAVRAEAIRRVHPARGLEAQYDQLAEMYRSVSGRVLRTRTPVRGS